MPRSPATVAILAGGSGTRFWPAGRATKPKQFLALDGDDTRPLLLATLERLAPLTDEVPRIIAPASLRAPLKKLLPRIRPEAFLLEPEPRNTAAAVALAAADAGVDGPHGPPAPDALRASGAARTARVSWVAWHLMKRA